MNDNDLDTLLSDFHDDVAPMSEEAFEAGRARLATVAESERVDEIPTLDPVLVELPPARTRHGPRRRGAVLATAAAAVVAVGAGAIVMRGDFTAEPATVSNPAELAEWAKGLADDPPEVAPGQYRHVHSMYDYTQTPKKENANYSYALTRTWIPYDFTDEWRLYKFGGQYRAGLYPGVDPMYDHPGNKPEDLRSKCGAFAHPGFMPLPDEPVEPPDPAPCDGDGWDGTGSPEFFHQWSDPQKLYDELSRRANGKSTEIFAQARELLQGNLPNEFKAALYQALSKTPGLEVLDQAPAGYDRTGIGLRVTQGPVIEQWVLDRVNGNYLLLAEEDATEGTIETFVYSVAPDANTIPNDGPYAQPNSWDEADNGPEQAPGDAPIIVPEGGFGTVPPSPGTVPSN